jgi:hypothetical protein
MAKKPRKISGSRVRVLVEIHIRHLPNTSRTLYSLSRLSQSPDSNSAQFIDVCPQCLCDLTGVLTMRRYPVQRIIRIPGFRINSESEQSYGPNPWRRKMENIILMSMMMIKMMIKCNTNHQLIQTQGLHSEISDYITKDYCWLFKHTEVNLLKMRCIHRAWRVLYQNSQ